MNYTRTLLLSAGLALAGSAVAGLPPPTPAQSKAAADKKAAADAQAAKEKEQLAASMDALSTRWRQRAASEGYKIRPPVVVASGTGAPVNQASAAQATKENIAAGMAVGTPSSVAPPPGAGIQAPPPQNAARGTAGAAAAPAAAPHSPQALNAANVPIKSEKHGTARASEDVKAGPTRAEPKNASPTVNRPGVPANAGKQ